MDAAVANGRFEEDMRGKRRRREAGKTGPKGGGNGTRKGFKLTSSPG